jgi:hypothetical protein
LSDLTSGRDISCLFGCAAVVAPGGTAKLLPTKVRSFICSVERAAYYRYVGMNKYPLMAQSEHDRQLGQYAGFAILP